SQGHVRVFDLIGGLWTQVGQTIDGEAPDDLFSATAISDDGSRIAIGARGNDGVNGLNSGHVRVFDLIGGLWTQVGVDIEGEVAGDWLGFAVAISGDGNRVVAGAYFNDNANGVDAGHVRTYELVGGVWTQIGPDLDGDTADDHFGYDVNLSADGSRLVVGARGFDGGGLNAGLVRVYDFSAGSWVQVGGDILGQAGGDLAGQVADISSDGTRVTMGSPLNDNGGGGSGQVRVFELSGGSWVQVGQDLDGEGASDNAGAFRDSELSADGSRVGVGAALNNSGGNDSGHVRVFELQSSFGPPPADVTIECDESSDPSNTGQATVSDNCDNSASISFSDVTNGLCPTVITRTWVAADNCGNTNLHVQTITIDDTTPPTAVCTDITVTLDENGDATITAADVDGGSSDNCDTNLTLSIDLDTFDCEDIGLTQQVTLTVTDDCGNMNTCVAQVTVEGDPLEITCPTNVVISCTADTDPGNTGTPTTEGGCPDPEDVDLDFEDTTSGSCPITISRVWTAEDGVGNEASCIQLITVVDDTPPVMNCPSNFEVKCDTPVDALDVGTLVECTGDTPGFDVRIYDTVSGAGNLAPISNLLGNPSFTPEVFTNSALNYANAAAMMADYPSLTDGNTFSIALLGIMAINTDDLGFWTLGTASGEGSMIYIDLNKDGDFADPGELIVDNNGNHGRRERTGEVCFFTPGCYPIVIGYYEASGSEVMEAKFGQGEGLTYPAMSFIDGSTNSAGPFYRSGTETPIVATATDACSSVVMTFEDTLTSGTCAGEQVLTRTWTATDTCGNTNSCDQVITFRDTEAPTIDGSTILVLQCNTNGGFEDDGTISNFFATLNVMDNCDPNPSIDIDEIPTFVASRCPNQTGGEEFQVTINDACDNEAEIDILIRV
ncbi:MAG: hypothetical protein AAF492_07565, partial [Verrucomicrobiota bacterium]